MYNQHKFHLGNLWYAHSHLRAAGAQCSFVTHDGGLMECDHMQKIDMH